MLYKRSKRATDMTAMSAEEQAKIMREETKKQGAVPLESQKGDAKSKLLKGIESGEIESVLVLDQDHSDIDPDEIKSPSPVFEMTMLQ